MLQDRERRGRLIAGTGVILFGVVMLINNYVEDNSLVAWLWIIALAGAAVAFGWVYATGKETWAAIVAYVTGAVAVLILLVAKLNLSGTWVPVLVLLAIAAPFVWAWWRDRKEWGLLIPAYVLAAIALGLLLLEAFALPDELLPAYVMFAIGLPFIAVALWRREWPFLIPGGILAVIGLVFLLTTAKAAGQVLAVVGALALIGFGVFMLLGLRSGEKEKRA